MSAAVRVRGDGVVSRATLAYSTPLVRGVERDGSVQEMQETVLAHFGHHWEAEFAQGYLEDAGIPSRLVSDGAAGGQPYVGGLAGASIRVAGADATRARDVLVSAGLLPGRRAEPDPGRALRKGGLGPLARADLEDLTERLEAARKAEVRHFIRCMLGMTPSAVIPFVGLALEGSVALIALLCVLVVFVEGWRWIRAGRLVRRLEAQLANVEDDD